MSQALQPASHERGVSYSIKWTHAEPAPCQRRLIQASLYLAELLSAFIDFTEGTLSPGIDLPAEVSCLLGWQHAQQMDALALYTPPQ
jgi:hypothetical protein